jgi:hypothetical protein
MRHHGHCFLVYSPRTSIEDSSEPFRALLGAILSVIKGVPVKRNEFNSDLHFDLIPELEDSGVLPEDGIEDQSGSYQGSSGNGIQRDPPQTRSRTSNMNESGLMVRSFSLAVICHFTHSSTLGYFILA